ncbi:hypothetical protein KUW04_10870 [Halomonas denitrificans]|nr:hypothetical protein [Halomonas denitrificans]
MVNSKKAVKLAAETIALFLIFNALAWQATIEEYFPKASLFDEIALLYMLMLYFLPGVQRLPRKVTYYFLMFLTVSGISTILSTVGRGITPIVLDLATTLKPYLFFVCLFGVSKVCFIKLKEYLIKSWCLLIPVIFLSGITNPFTQVFPSFDERLGVPAFHFILDNPGWYGNVIICILAVFFSAKYQWRFAYIVMLIVSGYLSLRGKTLVAISSLIIMTCAVKFNFYERYCHIKRKYLAEYRPKKSHVIFALLILTSLGLPQALHYFGGEVLTPRSVLLITSVDIANENFPLGSGLSTFGSPSAKIFYSPLYIEYGFNEIYGLNEHEPKFLNDNFWPTIIAQSGYLGFILYSLFFMSMMSESVKLCSSNKKKMISAMFVVVSLLLSTLGSAIFTSSLGMLHLMSIFVIAGNNERN